MTINITPQDLLTAALPASQMTLSAAEALATAHPDAELISLAAEFETNEMECEPLCIAVGDAEEKYPGPEAPEAMFVRHGDPRSLKSCKRGDGRWWYRGAIDDLRAAPRMRNARTEDGETIIVPDAKAQARAEEILAAFDRWKEACERDRVATGRADLEAALDRLSARFHIIMERAGRTEAKTLEGVTAKAKVAALRLSYLEEEAEIPKDRTLLASIIRDLVRLAGKVPLSAQRLDHTPE